MSDDWGENRPIPPAIVYKYVSFERIDVLRNGNIRFTPPLNTNDIFEVRQTFELLAGPRMKQLFAEQTTQIDFDEAISDAMVGTPLSGKSPNDLRQFFKSTTGSDLEVSIQKMLGVVLNDTVFPTMNSPQAIDGLLTNLASGLICLSLTERFDSSPMWAHYSGNSTGFVIAFDTTNGFFRRGEKDERQGLQKISYFDGKLAEVMDDPYAALMSKQKAWVYEREWRLYLKADQASKVLTTGDEAIHLVDFPPEAVQRVILGLHASGKLEQSLKAVLAARYPHATLSRLSANRATASLTESAVT